ncbi:hypothetical protein HZR84_14325 [Hyphobacterium sp. CCMP332]|nr:hypothetical protein HZR84_14325 [Hyphobacterium sp. CCMP332]
MNNCNKLLALFTVLLTSNFGIAQISGSMAPNMAVPTPAEPSKISAGQYVGNVNTYSGTYQNNVNLGVVSTPGGLSYSVDCIPSE